MKKNKNLANIITFARILGVALIFWFTPFNEALVSLYVISIYILISATDFLDGWIARKLKIVSDFGKVLDPLADKLLILVFLPLLSMQVIASFPVFIILAREFSIMAIRVLSAKQGIIIPAKFSGKLKTALTFPLCGILFGRVTVNESHNIPLFLKPLDILRQWVYSCPQIIIDVLIWATVFVTIWSFIDYLKDFFLEQSLKKAKGNKEEARKKMLAIIPAVITLLNFSCGIFAIFFAIFHTLEIAVACILIGMFLDAIDGKIARKLNVMSQLGETLDTKADLISFGLAPAFIIFKLFYSFEGNLNVALSIILGVLFFASVYYRLKRFTDSGHSHIFDGFPSPIGAAVVVLSCVSFMILQSYFLLLFIILFTMYLMVSKIPYFHVGYAGRHTYLKYFVAPSLTVFFLVIFMLLGVPFLNNFYLVEILLVFTLIYLTSPLFLLKHKQKS